MTEPRASFNVTIDCVDPAALAAFYGTLLGRDVVAELGPYVVLRPDGRGAPTLIFQKVPDPTPGKAKAHIDVHVPDVDTATDLAVSLGAVRGVDVSEGPISWRTMTDPEGNPFCLAGLG